MAKIEGPSDSNLNLVSFAVRIIFNARSLSLTSVLSSRNIFQDSFLASSMPFMDDLA
jgi:hypothetical protein